MKLLDWLRRLGILHFGTTAGIYHNALERPLSLQMGDVFDSRRDVIKLDTPDSIDSQGSVPPKEQEGADATSESL